MIAAEEQASPAETACAPTPQDRAQRLAGAHRNLARASARAQFVDLHGLVVALEEAESRLLGSAFDSASLSTAAEWYLDNYHLVRRVARQLVDELGRRFVHHLPWVSSAQDAGFPRVYAAARALVVTSSMELDAAALSAFIEGYQREAPLTIAELWALPMMLRVVVLQGLVQALRELGVVDSPGRSEEIERLEVDPTAVVERSVRALRLLAEIDWQAFFQSTSRVEALLGTDPAGVYTSMDFKTCDEYRKAVEDLAWGSKTGEQVVAEQALALARECAADPRRGHVGYYLVDQGRRELEEQLGYRPAPLQRLRRAILRRPTAFYLCALAALTAVPVGAGVIWLYGHGVSQWLPLAVAVALVLFPASAMAVAALNWSLAHLLRPRTLPKLDMSSGLPADCRTLVVIPTLLGDLDDVNAMTRRIELHYLSNPDPALQFALLTDSPDSSARSSGDTVLDSAERAIADLNRRHGDGTDGPFHLLHREPVWSSGEGCFMGWERKRGKLEELNRLLRGESSTAYARQVGNPAALRGIRFVITLDSDTQLPMGAAHKLVGLMSHPLNRPVVDPRTGRVTHGYTVVQPRVDTAPFAARTTPFSRLFAGDVGFDIYTHASSDTYQDLFGAGSYVGKGIYDVEAFATSLEDRIPENTVVSHDLLEGIHGRAGLATDVLVFEDYPSSYLAYARRVHRWVRGDWQLIPWLGRRVPSRSGAKLPNRLSLIDRWKIVDNLRRSLVGPSCVLLLMCAWTWLPGSAAVWTVAIVAALVFPMLPSAQGGRRRIVESLARAALAVTFLAHQAAIAADAIARALVRMTVTRRHLLEWTASQRAARQIIDSRGARSVVWREMAASPALSAVATLLVAVVRPSSLPVVAPVVALWLLAPEIARWLSRPSLHREQPIGPAERRRLRKLARRTWHFFETHVGPHDQWLPIDNYQEAPREQTAHRTSPTNIGLLLLSTVSAYDLGYLEPAELSLRLRNALESVSRLAHYQGHLLNWYETKSLEPLRPAYVSTVDSGNFAGCLVALEHACKQIASDRVLRAPAWDGLGDLTDLIEEALGLVLADARGLRALLDDVRAALERGRAGGQGAYDEIRRLNDVTVAELDRQLLVLLESGVLRHEVSTLHALRTWLGALHDQLRRMRDNLDALLPWLGLAHEPAASAFEIPVDLGLDQIPRACERAREDLDAWVDSRRASSTLTPEHAASSERLREALSRGAANAEALRRELLELAARASAEARGMDFRLLYDAQRKLFRIGYNATLDQADAHHYDLLASEARLASYVAIAKRDVPEKHWYALGRPMTSIDGAPALLSWGGTMFEYLMPTLLMRSAPGTLLAQSCELAVKAQIEHGASLGLPWGVSECAFARVDAHGTYQYRSFGVPGLGFKRGLEDDRVVAPYASMLAVSARPRDVLDNLTRLESMGMVGDGGLFEAADFRPERMPDGRSFTVVRSYMAHHQGMSLVALDNLLNRDVMVERFHVDPLMQTAEMLLDERAPATAPAEWPVAHRTDAADAPLASVPAGAPAAWTPPAGGRPQAFVLTNSRLSSLVTDAGGGGLRWEGLAITRYEPDPTCDTDGLWIYVHDEESGAVSRATSALGRTTFAAHSAEFHRRERGLSIRVEIAIAPSDDVEVRLITLHNETDAIRHLTLTTASEPVLLPAEQAARHPAFSRMFVETELVAELDGLLVARRHGSASEPRALVLHRLVCEEPHVAFAGYETDRGAFIGMRGAGKTPAGVEQPRRRGRLGNVIDPVMSLSAGIELRPKRTATLAIVTSVGRSRGEVVALARRYGTLHAVQWAFRDAHQQSSRRLQRLRIDPGTLPAMGRLFSALLHADAEVRAPPSVLLAGRPVKERLWAHGISGDFPILAVRVHDARVALVREAIASHRFLQSCGVTVELVFLDEHPSGYADEGGAALRAVIKQEGADDWMGRRGGMFIVSLDRLALADRSRIEASARALLDTRDGTLAAAMSRTSRARPSLPRFEPTITAEIPPRRPTLPPLQFDNGTGGFTQDGQQYVIRVGPRHAPPAPWCNVLANREFGCLVSESSLGFTWSMNSGENRLTPWRNDPVLDTPSEVLYLRDEETAVVWSPTPLPAGFDAETVVRHGAGYTTYTRDSHGLEQQLTVFVPPEGAFKIVRLRMRNTLPRHRRITATYYAEWVLGARRSEQQAYVTSELVQESACLLASCDWNGEFAGRVAFLASEAKVHGYTADRGEFLGRGGDYASPEALERWGLSGQTEAGIDPCAALQVHVDLAPGEEIETHFVIGQATDRRQALEVVARLRQRAEVDRAWEATIRFWDDLLGNIQVKTPQPSMDLLLNRWLLYQVVSARFFGRTGFYQSSGAYGYRDQLQDVLALLHAAPSMARAHILEAASHQFEEGDVLHWWHPPSGRGVRTRCSDDMAWLPFVTAEYVSATGDTSILDEAVTFLAGEPLKPDEHERYAPYRASERAAPLLDHCRRSLERALTRGRHGLPLMGDGDWNDGMNRVGWKGLGESVWLGWFLIATIRRFASLCDDPEAALWTGRAEALRSALESSAWDGAWYLRAFHDDGSPLGSPAARECRIDSIAQSWAVMSGVADGDRARMALRSTDQQLVDDGASLVRLLWPPFESLLHDPGYIRAYPPGVRENGGQYTHAATWVGWAHATLRQGDHAEHIFRLLDPVQRTRTREQVERYRLEPYVLAGDVYGSPPWVGRGGWSWYTGAAAWTWRLGIEAILGLQRRLGRLRVDPCIPTEWTGVEAWMRLNASRLHVIIENPDGVTSGVLAATLDGIPVDARGIEVERLEPGERELRVRLGIDRSAVKAGPRDAA